MPTWNLYKHENYKDSELKLGKHEILDKGEKDLDFTGKNGCFAGNFRRAQQVNFGETTQKTVVYGVGGRPRLVTRLLLGAFLSFAKVIILRF